MPSIQTQQQTRFAIPSYAGGVFETFGIDGSQQLDGVNEPSNDLQPPFIPDTEKAAQLVTLSPANINILVPPFLERDLLPPLPPVDQPRVSRDNDQLHSVPLINRNSFIAKNSPTTFVQFRQNGAAIGLANPTISPPITTTTDSTATEPTSMPSTTTDQLEDTTTITPETTTTITTASEDVEPLTTTLPPVTTEAPRKSTKLTTKSTTAATTSTTIRTTTTKKSITMSTKSPVTPIASHPIGRQVLIGFKSAFTQTPTKFAPQLKASAPIQIDFTSEEVKKILGFQSSPGYAIRPDGTVDADLLPVQPTFNFVAKPSSAVLNPSPSTISTTFAAKPSTVEANIFGGNFSFHTFPKTPSVVVVETQPNQNVPFQSTSFAFGSLASSGQPLAPTPPENNINSVPSVSFNRIDFKPQIFQPQPFAHSPFRQIDKSTTTAPPSPSPLQPVKVPASNSFLFNLNADRLTTTEHYQPLTTTKAPVISRISFGESTIATDDSTTTEIFQTTTYATERSTEEIATTTTIAVPEIDLLPPFGPTNDSKLPSNASEPVDELVLDLLPPQIFQPTFDLLPPLPTALTITPNATETPKKNDFLPILDLNPFLPPFSSPDAQSTQNYGNAIKLSYTTTSAPVSSTQNINKPSRGQVKYSNGDNGKKDVNVPNHASSNDRYTGGFGAPTGILSPQYNRSN